MNEFSEHVYYCACIVQHQPDLTIAVVVDREQISAPGILWKVFTEDWRLLVQQIKESFNILGNTLYLLYLLLSLISEAKAKRWLALA